MYCTNCGRKIKDGERYCPYCGTKTFDEKEFNQQRVNIALSRRSIPICIILSIVTFGIYGLYWLYCLARDINILTNQEQPSGIKVLLLSIVTLGIYEFYWLYKAGERLNELQTSYDNYRPLVYLILSVLGWDIIAWALIQNELNKYAYDS